MMVSPVLVYPQGSLSRARLCSGGGLSRGDFCPWVSVKGGFLSRDLSVQGSLSGEFVQKGMSRGLCPGDGGVSVQ